MGYDKTTVRKWLEEVKGRRPLDPNRVTLRLETDWPKEVEELIQELAREVLEMASQRDKAEDAIYTALDDWATTSGSGPCRWLNPLIDWSAAQNKESRDD